MDPGLVRITLPGPWRAQLREDSEYITLVTKYCDSSPPSGKGGAVWDITLPEILTYTGYVSFFSIFSARPDLGPRVRTKRMWGAMRGYRCHQWVKVLLFLGMQKTLRQVIEYALSEHPTLCATIIGCVMNEMGSTSRATHCMIESLCRRIRANKTNEEIIGLYVRDEQNNLITVHMVEWITAALRQDEGSSVFVIRPCAVCSACVKCFYMTESLMERPRLKLAYYMPCCATPVHKECYLGMLQDNMKCGHCLSEFVSQTLDLAPDQRDPCSRWLRAQLRNFNGISPGDKIPGPPTGPELWKL